MEEGEKEAGFDAFEGCVWVCMRERVDFGGAVKGGGDSWGSAVMGVWAGPSGGDGGGDRSEGWGAARMERGEGGREWIHGFNGGLVDSTLPY